MESLASNKIQPLGTFTTADDLHPKIAEAVTSHLCGDSHLLLQSVVLSSGSEMPTDEVNLNTLHEPPSRLSFTFFVGK